MSGGGLEWVPHGVSEGTSRYRYLYVPLLVSPMTWLDADAHYYWLLLPCTRTLVFKI